MGWEGDPECADGSVVMDDDKNCTAVFDLRGLSAGGTAHGAGGQGSAGVQFNAEFAFSGAIDLTSATLTLNALLAEEQPGGAGELVSGVPIVLQFQRGGRAGAASFETAPGVTPRVRVSVQIKQPSLSTFDVQVQRATLLASPLLCSFASRIATTTLTTRFTIDDGVNSPITVTTREPWQCLGGNPSAVPFVPHSLKKP